MENKENIFTRFMNFIKKIFGKDAPKQITEKSQVIEEPVSKTNFFDEIKVVPEESTVNSKSMDLQKRFENDEIDLCVMSDEEIHEFEEQMQKNLQNERKKLFEKYPHIEKDQNETISKENLLYKIQLIQNNINNKKVKLHTLELDKNVITPNLEKLANMEEEICNLQEQKKELQKLNTAIEITKQILEQSYETMKHTITPKFTQNLSNNISKITNGKYNNVRFNDETGLIVENENGEYIPAKKLSIGTIEQLYLSLRLSMIDEISDEKLPIILDESFAYFDADRLKNFLMYIYEIYSDRQIILLTCTNREKEVLDENEIMYKYIEI